MLRSKFFCFWFLKGFMIQFNVVHSFWKKVFVPFVVALLVCVVFVSCNTLPHVKASPSILVKKIWIRETFPKNFTKPSVGQSIPPVLNRDNGLVIQGNKSNGISAYTTVKGQKKWFFPVKGGLSGGVLLAGSHLFFGGMDGFIYALTAKTGKMVWKHHTGQTTVSTPAKKGSYLYFASPNKLYRLNAKTGAGVSTYSTQSEPGKFIVQGVASPLPTDFLIYFKANDDSIIALDLKNRFKWKRKLSDTHHEFTSASSNIIIGPVCLYTASLQAGLYCLNKKTGKTLWKNTIGSHGDILLSGPLLFYPSQDGHVLALDQKSGKTIWKHKVPNSIATSLALYKDMLVYGEYTGALRFLSRSTGKEMGYFTFGGGMSAPPAVSVADSAFYFISRAGWLYKIRPRVGGTKVVDLFYRKDMVEEQAHKL